MLLTVESKKMVAEIAQAFPEVCARHQFGVLGSYNLRQKLNEKGLPQTKVSVPLSGYLYFSFSKRKKDAKYHLEYAVKGGSLNLPLP